MLSPRLRLCCCVLLSAGAASLGACGSFADSTRSALRTVTPYKVEVVQGNFVSKEQVAALAPGQTKQQVRQILGTSLLTDIFHADRWDYVFTIQRQGVDAQKRHLALFFKGDVLDHFEGDEMPSEDEFVAALDSRRSGAKPPRLEITDEERAKLQSATPKGTVTTSQAADAAPLPPLPASYPPLEARR